jgi:hypothetical protein
MVTRVRATPVASHRRCRSTQLLALQRLLLPHEGNRLAQDLVSKGVRDA